MVALIHEDVPIRTEVEFSNYELRGPRDYSQKTLAELLGMNQGDLSKFERRTDAYLST
jgi:hypothetical protein